MNNYSNADYWGMASLIKTVSANFDDSLKRMVMKLFTYLLFTWSLSAVAFAQGTFPVNGAVDERHITYAFTGARIYVDHETVLDNATLVVKGQRILSCGTNVTIPKGAVVVALNGKYIYPTFTDLWSDYGMPEVTNAADGRNPNDQSRRRKGSFGWNDAIRSDFDAARAFQVDTGMARAYRRAGFGFVLTHRHDGIQRGTGMVVAVAQGRPQDVILNARAGSMWSFEKGSSKQSYPSSLMGSIALIRQTLYDARWYAQVRGKDQVEYNETLEQLVEHRDLNIFLDAGDPFQVLRSAKLAKEFGIRPVLKADEQAYQRVQEIAKTGLALILPLDLPKPYDLLDPYDAGLVSLEGMKHWEWAPHNARIIAENNIRFALTAYGNKKKPEFLDGLRRSYSAGLSESAALKALTTTPAKILGREHDLGRLRKGFLAAFFISDGNILDQSSRVLETWILGYRHTEEWYEGKELRGSWQLSIADRPEMTFDVQGRFASPKIKMISPDSIQGSIRREGNLISLAFRQSDGRLIYQFSGLSHGKTWEGEGTDSMLRWTNWSAKQTATWNQQHRRLPQDSSPSLSPMRWPFMSFGWEEKPDPESVVIRNATVWTGEDAGILEATDIWIHLGKIKAIGKNLSAPGAMQIHANGQHVTAGIVDEHSHIAISGGVNEGTQASSAEVRIGDVINPDNMHVYRQLAGGVTSAQLLHGSANPIGGQSAIIKLRWGAAPEEMKISDAPGFIKFALGENVKQTNWGDRFNRRFPQTRMGVEQVYMDAFTRAQEYAKAKRSGTHLGLPVRTDLELEALVEILEKKRFITCHSYVQSEINMLMHTAEHFGFRINTFTHILEGYKVAEKMRAHGVAASTFADWWAYKYEVIDAIPYNAALLWQAGVLTALNSDDAEMGRRLNQEAAKAVKYGQVPEEEAWKMVTINPAKMLHIDHRTGSLVVGKDADIVLWSDHPMSVYARCLATWVDGIRYYDQARHEGMKTALREERRRLIGKMNRAANKGDETQAPVIKQEEVYHCDDL